MSWKCVRIQCLHGALYKVEKPNWAGVVEFLCIHKDYIIWTRVIPVFQYHYMKAMSLASAFVQKQRGRSAATGSSNNRIQLTLMVWNMFKSLTQSRERHYYVIPHTHTHTSRHTHTHRFVLTLGSSFCQQDDSGGMYQIIKLLKMHCKEYYETNLLSRPLITLRCSFGCGTVVNEKVITFKQKYCMREIWLVWWILLQRILALRVSKFL